MGSVVEMRRRVAEEVELVDMVVVAALYLRFGAESRASRSPDAEDADATLALEEG